MTETWTDTSRQAFLLGYASPITIIDQPKNSAVNNPVSAEHIPSDVVRFTTAL